MIRLIMSLTVAVLLYFVYGFYLAWVDISVVDHGIGPLNPPNFSLSLNDYRGVINVRSSYSTGVSSPLKIVSEAKAAGLDFIFFTDVNSSAKEDLISGYHGSLIASYESEYKYLDSRIDLISEKNLDRAINNSQIMLTDILSQTNPSSDDYLAILAHPFNPGPTWTGELPTGLDGIEVLNPHSISQKAWLKSKLNVIWSFVVYPFNAEYAFVRLFQEPTAELSAWDKRSQERSFFGIAGSEASARAIPIANTLLKFPSYQKSFELMSNHVLLRSELTGNYQKDRVKIIQALKEGQFYMALDLLGDPKGFNCWLEDSKKNVFLMGAKTKLSKGLSLQYSLPQKPKSFFEVILTKNGDSISLSNEAASGFKIDSPGVYRISVRVSPSLPLPDGKKWITWIYSNPFYVSP